MRRSPSPWPFFAAAALLVVFCYRQEAAAGDTYLYTLKPGADAGTLAYGDGGIRGSQLMVECANFDARVKLCDFGPLSCSATANDSHLFADKQHDICTSQWNDRISVFRVFDGGVPDCRVYLVNPRTVCPP